MLSRLIERISFLQGLFALCGLWLIVAAFEEGSETQKKIVMAPDFKSIKSIPERKAAFFGFFGSLVDEENQRILELRKKLQNDPSESLVKRLAERYDLSVSADVTEDDLSELLELVDVVPKSLALAQAAIESGWGMSRFAVEGNNFYGQWCYTKGCGLVPANRNSGASHEVRRFDSPAQSVAAYMFNINSHRSYKNLRKLRANARDAGKEIHGCELAQGLVKYSERGQHYVDEVKQMIRWNDLTPFSEKPCADSI